MTTHKEALKLARSVISSINQGKQHALTHNDETVFWQREEWVRWALDEVLPLIEEALAQPEQEPVGEAYLCDICQTPFDGAYECPSCGHNEATKEPLYTHPQQAQPKAEQDVVSGKTFDQWVALNEANAARVLELEEKLAKQEQGEPVLEIVNGKINRAWDAIPADFTGLLYMQSHPSVPSKKPQEPWYGSARVDDYNRGWNDCIDSINAIHQPSNVTAHVAIYMGHRLTPEGTKEFWGWADSPLPVGTKLYTTPQQRKPLTDEQISNAYLETDEDIENGIGNFRDGVRFAEAAHGIKG
jgi:hypothetical protein